MTKPTTPTLSLVTAMLLLAGCATSERVSSSSVTKALDLDKTDRFAVTIADTASSDTAFSSEMQKAASSELIDELEERGFDYVGERSPQIRAVLRTHPATQASYLQAAFPEVVTITTTKETESLNGTVTTISKTSSLRPRNENEPIYVPANSRIILLDIYDVESEALLWRGHLNENDTSLSNQQLAAAIETLVERLDEET